MPPVLMDLDPHYPVALRGMTTTWRQPGRNFASRLLIEAGHVTAALAGELDRPVVSDLECRFAEVDAAEPSTVILDLGGVSFVDVAATRCLMTWAADASRRGIAVMIRHPPRLLPAIATLLGFPVEVVLVG